ncbi:MAG: cytochrome-c oxidase, cbb3-type subunit III [Hyphomicrobium sp.]|uniref:cytochrome-c oxidase, cbb3-type subunit III n=1 Tax=Hyphomicrobium sp. TaxID=82 RepID=UPI00132B650B|nr:cytochrome-c oxidase, cbb3-type subunit III [Hyphomicrobium sp.]KAB2939965.1 MAG: cytochrome-c oxidase, cbb3-type subunit III [Hyphomicrobium sp.]MBZ0209901.1 cytochrome-c oxidase, cbb3-type subunit III [Hyphomicrobium sp.]
MTGKEIDSVTGVETTGHVWDGDLKELNKPLPRWWLYVLYATIVWAVGYWIVYPAWPTLHGYTKGVLDYSQRGEVDKEVAAAKAAQAKYFEQIAATPIAEIEKNQELLPFVMAGGAAVFGDKCGPCHGKGGGGAVGYPNLNDDDWLWGGSPEAIEHTIQVGIRSGHPEARDMAMPRFGLDGILKPAEIADTAQFVLSLSGHAIDTAAAERGSKIFADNCASCHGEAGKGNQDVGAPNLTDGIWLYGGKLADIEKTIETGRGGVMPYWSGRLDPVTIKMLAAYVHSLGGGK